MQPDPEAGKEIVAARQQLPSWDDMQKDPVVGKGMRPMSPAERLRHGIAPGETAYRIEGHAAARRFSQMKQGWRRREVERGAKASAAIETVRFRTPAGGTLEIPERQAEAAERKGFRLARARGRRLPLEAAMSQACPRCGYNRLMGRCTCEVET